MSKVTGVVDWAGENKFGGFSIRRLAILSQYQ